MKQSLCGSRKLYIAFVVALMLGLSACASWPDSDRQLNGTAIANSAAVQHINATSTQPTVLLVSLPDGSIIKQNIEGYGDFCFKSAENTETRCLSQGEAIYDPVTKEFVGYQMIAKYIHLEARQPSPQ